MFQKLSWRPFFKNSLLICVFENSWGNSPTCPKFETHTKVALHFFILILLLPKTPSSTYPNIKKFKGSFFMGSDLTPTYDPKKKETMEIIFKQLYVPYFNFEIVKKIFNMFKTKLWKLRIFIDILCKSIVFFKIHSHDFVKNRLKRTYKSL